MPDVATDVPGARLRRLRGENYVVVTIAVMFPGSVPTIAGLAKRMHLQADLVFQVLLGYRNNDAFVKQIYRDEIGTPFPGLEQARRELREHGTRGVMNRDFPMGTTTPYLIWPVDPGGAGAVFLPLSSGFKSVMRQATEERKREVRLRAVTPSFDALARDIAAMRAKAFDLSTDISLLKALSADHARDLAILEALDGLLGAMLTFPKRSVAADDRRGIEDLRTRLATLMTEARRHMVLDPPDVFRAGLVRSRDRNAADLRAMLEAATLVDRVRALAENRDIAPPRLWQDTVDAVGVTVQALLGSAESDRVLDAHVVPMIQELASRQFDLTGLSAPTNPAFDRAFREVAVAPARNTVVVILVNAADMGRGAVGNYPGPSTLVVGILEVATPILMGRVARNAAEATALAGRLYRTLVIAANLVDAPGAGGSKLAERVAILEAIDRGNLAALRQIKWPTRFLSSPTWGGVVAVLSMVVLMNAVQSDDASTVRRWATIISSGTGTALGVAVAVGRWSSLVEQGIVKSIGGKALGLVGAVAAAVSGVVTAREEYETGDRVGAVVSATGAVGGGIAVVGFAIAAATAASATGIGIPLGVALMAVGAIISIGAAIFGTVRAVRTTGTQVVFEAMLNHFGRESGPLDRAADARPTLRSAFRAVQTFHHGLDFWAVHPDKLPELFDLGFAVEHLVPVVDEPEAVVRNSLRRAQRID